MTLDELMNMRSDGEAVLEDKGVPEEI